MAFSIKGKFLSVMFSILHNVAILYPSNHLFYILTTLTSSMELCLTSSLSLPTRHDLPTSPLLRQPWMAFHHTLMRALTTMKQNNLLPVSLTLLGAHLRTEPPPVPFISESLSLPQAWAYSKSPENIC